MALTMSKISTRAAIVALAASAFLTCPAMAQLSNDPANVAGSSAFENSIGGAVSQRSPGLLVTAGVARQQATVLSPRVTFSHITEPPRDEWQDIFYINAINDIFTNLNEVLLEIGIRVAQRLGNDPQIPDGVGFTTDNTNNDNSSGDQPTDSSDTGDDTNDGTNDATNDGTNGRSKKPGPVVSRVLRSVGRKN